jgi:hypothetical protein
LSDAAPAGLAAGSACPVGGVRPGARYRVRELSLADGDRDHGVLAGSALLADGVAWPLTAARTAAIWLLEEEG